MYFYTSIQFQFSTCVYPVLLVPFIEEMIFFSLFPHVCHWCFCKDELVKIERIYYWVLYSIYWCTCLFYSILDVQVCFTLYLGGQVCFILYLGGQVCFVPVNANFIVMALCHNLKLSTKCLQNYSFYLLWLLMVILHL